MCVLVVAVMDEVLSTSQIGRESLSLGSCSMSSGSPLVSLSLIDGNEAFEMDRVAVEFDMICGILLYG